MNPAHLAHATVLSHCLLLASGGPVPYYSSPEIIESHRFGLKPQPGDSQRLRCTARADGEADRMLIYWLVDDQFPEDAPSHDRIVELEETTLENGTILQRDLLVKNVQPDDFNLNFTCVVTNAAGSTRRVTTLLT